MRPFDALGPRCRLLLTTRDAGLIAALGATERYLDVLDGEQALKLLAEWAGVRQDVRRGRGRIAHQPRQIAHGLVDSLLRREQERHATDWIDADRQQVGLAALAYCMQIEGEYGTTVERAWSLEYLSKAAPGYEMQVACRISCFSCIVLTF